MRNNPHLSADAGLLKQMRHRFCLRGLYRSNTGTRGRRRRSKSGLEAPSSRIIKSSTTKSAGCPLSSSASASWPQETQVTR